MDCDIIAAILLLLEIIQLFVTRCTFLHSHQHSLECVFSQDETITEEKVVMSSTINVSYSDFYFPAEEIYEPSIMLAHIHVTDIYNQVDVLI